MAHFGSSGQNARVHPSPLTPAGATVFLNAHASTPLDPRVEPCVLAWSRHPGNASSPDPYGVEALAMVQHARGRVAALLGCEADEVIFTSGATQANNLALRGVLGACARRGDARGRPHAVVSAIEHSSVLECAKAGAHTVVPVDGRGVVDPQAVARALTPETRLVSVMLANNEVGTIQPIAEIVRAVRSLAARAGMPVLVHVDAAQGFGRLPFNVRALDVDLATLSGHKVYGPRGIGVLYVRRGVDLAPVLLGGSQERGLAPGTINSAGIAGMVAAAELAVQGADAENARLGTLRGRLLDRIVEGLGADVVHVNGAWGTGLRLPHNLHVTLLGCCPEAVHHALAQEVAVSAAAACKAGKGSSHVLAAMGAPDTQQGAPIRFGLSRFTTPEEIERAADAVVRIGRQTLGQGCATASGGASGTSASSCPGGVCPMPAKR